MWAIVNRGSAILSLYVASGTVASGGVEARAAQVEDAEIPPQFREVFIEESEEIVGELVALTATWREDPKVDGVLRDIRRHFHTFKGNGRAVGANVLGELGWAAQDMLDRVLDGELIPDGAVQSLLLEVVEELPDLVNSYQRVEGPDLDRVRQLTSECFRLAEGRERSMADALDATPGSPAQQALPAVVAESVTH